MGVSAPRVTAVVPTLGKSPALVECLAALRQDGGPGLRILLVAQGKAVPAIPAQLGVERLEAAAALGFARAANLGIAAARTPLVALVNDDAVVESPWLEPLVAALDREPRAAAAQGVNLDAADPQHIDGWGLAWNRRWQAVQLGHGRPASEAPREDREVFGVSATAAIYRRDALAAVALDDSRGGVAAMRESGAATGAVFDARLGSYYEDAELACRLRAPGHSAVLAAHARCRHLGSATSSESARLALIFRNRYAVLARALGRAFWPRLPWLVVRDLATLAAAAARGEGARASAMARGLASAPFRLTGFAHLGAPIAAASEMRRTAEVTSGAEAGASHPHVAERGEAHANRGAGRVNHADASDADAALAAASAVPPTRPELAPRLEGLVVHWRSAPALDRLLAAWPDDPRFGLIVVDNSGELALQPRPGLRLLRPGSNLGFAGGVDRALELASAPYVCLLNPDARPFPGAVEELARSLDEHPEWAGVAPRLVGDDGEPQYEWQLRPLPSPGGLLRQVFFFRGVARARAEPPAGTAIAQPAAAVLALRRSVLAEMGGLDASFYPAWFEDVDFCARLARSGRTLHYWPAATFAHGLGGSLESLGYGAFLWIYYRNLVRYLRQHHGAGWAAAALICLPAAALARALLLPLHRPRRASDRGDALRGLAGLALGAATGFRAPAKLSRSFAAPVQ